VIVAQPLQFSAGACCPVRSPCSARRLARIRFCRREIVSLVAQARCGLALDQQDHAEDGQSGGQQTEFPFCPMHDFKNQFDGGVGAFGVLLVKKIGTCMRVPTGRPPFWPGLKFHFLMDSRRQCRSRHWWI